MTTSTRCGPWLLKDRLGKGGMGEVFRAEAVEGPDAGKSAAVKLFPGDLDPQDPELERFRREVAILSGLDHPGIVRALGPPVAEAGRTWYAMELVQGPDLARLLRDKGRLPPARAIEIAVQLLDALEHAHASGVVHRDVKPGNVLLEPDGRARLADFGLARVAGRSNLTRTGTVLGTPEYMSPEQAQGEEAGARSDLYALGVTLWLMLAGRPPFEASSPLAVLRQHVEKTPPPLPPGLGLPAGLEGVIRRALAKSPADRWPTAGAMAEALRALPPAPPPSAEGRLEDAITNVLEPGTSETRVETPSGNPWWDASTRQKTLPPGSRKDPDRVGSWKVLERLGAGGEGVVYLAESTDGLAKRVALKCWPKGARARYERELETYRRLEDARQKSHSPNLVEGLAAGTLEDGTGFLALAWQPGGSLADRLRRDGPLPAPDALRVGCDLMAGLGALHAAGLSHRDVKPANLLLGADGRVRLGDFGLAAEESDSIGGSGTPGFAAPEQMTVVGSEAASAGVAIDLYGAGATLYCLLSGRPPLPGQPDLFRLEAAKVPRPLQKVLLRALAREPEARFASAAEMSAALEEAGREAAAPPPAQRGPWVWLGGAVLFLLVAGWLGRSPPEPPGPAVAPTNTGSGPPAEPAAPASASAAAVPSPGAPLIAPPPELLELEHAAGESRVSLRGPAGRRWIGAFPGRALLARYDARRALLALPAHDGRPPELRLYHGGVLARALELEAEPTALLAVPPGRAAVGTAEGAVLLLDLTSEGAAAQVLHRGPGRVLGLERRGDELRARIDRRVPRALGQGEKVRPGEREVAGELGRYAWRVEPVIAVVVVGLKD